VSLLDFGKARGESLELTPFDAGTFVYAGVGAVGNAGIWCLSKDSGITGSVTLIDPESVTLSNLQRYLLTTMDHVDGSKVEMGKSAFQGHGLRVETYSSTLEHFAEAHGTNQPCIIVSVDNVAGRRTAQGLLPRLLVNGWTGDQSLGASWHVFSREAACLACLYHPHAQGVSAVQQAANVLGLSHDRTALLWVSHLPLSDEDIHLAAARLGVDESVLNPWRGKTLGELYTDVVCGAVSIDVQAVGRMETVPLAHQSALAGVLMAAEFVKRVSPKLSKSAQREPLVSWDNVLQPPPRYWKKPRSRERGCICSDPDYQSIYSRKWPNRIGA
jgi:hypothetical protein